MFALPEPPLADQAKSLRLVERLREATAPGPISFADYMARVLYAPDLGYYASGQVRFGPEGDFTTAPERSPFFAAGLAYEFRNACRSGLPAVLLEFGAGSGQLMVDLLEELARTGELPERYLIHEISPALRARQQQRIAALPDDLRRRVHWVDDLNELDWTGGIVVANEVLDAMPVERFRWVPGRPETAVRQGVRFEGERLAWADMPDYAPLNEYLEALCQQARWAVDAEQRPVAAEANLNLPDWLTTLFATLSPAGQTPDRRGTWLYLFDYGGNSWDIYRPDRVDGTLRCHYRHLAHDDPFVYPGLQDVTTWVDFQQLARQAERCGFAVDGERSQAEWLLGTDVPSRFSTRMAQLTDRAEATRIAQGFKELVMPTEMGERFRVLRLRTGC